MAALLLQSCRGGRPTPTSDKEENIIKYARNLYMMEDGEFTRVEIRNPWDTTHTLARYILVPEGSQKKPRDTNGYTLISTPLRNTVVFSSVHASLLSEMGCADVVSGVCDPQFLVDSVLLRRYAEGKIKNCGSPMQPNIEVIFRTGAQGILLSPYEGDAPVQNSLRQCGIPLIEGADYLEKTPLARAEWMRLYGRLYGNGEKADSLFAVTEKEYLALKEKISNPKARIPVIFDMIYSGTWAVPTSGSVLGSMISDAGGLNPFSGYNKAGCATLSPEEALYRGKDAKVWFIRYNQKTPLTLKQISSENKLYTEIEAYKQGNVYGTNTLTGNIFDESAFHPQWVLSDMISILHPEAGIRPYKRYYHQLSE